MNVQTRVKERAEEQSSAMNDDQQAAIRMLANDLHRLNHSIMNSSAPAATIAARAIGAT